jgi:N utilization substance protein A
MTLKKTKRKNKQAKSKAATAKSVKTSHKKAVHKAKKPSTKKARKDTTSTTRRGYKKTSVNSERDIQQEFRSKAPRRIGFGQQSGDLQDLSRAQQADSESVDELVEEGNIFEAGAVAGVEEAESADQREVHTHEVPEDDVPEEYLDKD